MLETKRHKVAGAFHHDERLGMTMCEVIFAPWGNKFDRAWHRRRPVTRCKECYA